MSNLMSALRGEIEAIVRREVRLALKGLSTAAAPDAGKRGPGRPAKSAQAAKASGVARVAVSAKDLQSLRGKLKVSGPELGRLAGVSTATIYNWEKAKGSVNIAADVAATVVTLQAMTAELARAKLGPAAKRGRKPGQIVTAKKRGRPAKVKPAEAAVPAAAPKKRGRPAKVKPAEAAAPAAAPKKRGRPAKVKPAEAAAAAAAAPKKRGRPAKVKPAEATAPAAAAPKKRGRPAKVKPAETPAPAAT